MIKVSTSYKYLSNLTCMIEWYEFALLGYFLPFFQNIFFPLENGSAVHLSSAWLLYAAGFISRPIGAFVFGYIGDKYGRVKAVKYTPLLIMILSLAFISLPSYMEIGVISAYAVIILRLLNGVVIGGEFSGNIVYTQEVSKRRWKYFWGSISSCSASMGILFASLAVSLVYRFYSKNFVKVYAWKIPYLFAAFLCLVAFLVRSKMPESADFLCRAKQTLNPLHMLFSKHMKLLICLFGIIAYHAVTFYFIFTFLPVMLMVKYSNIQASVLLKNSFFLAIHIALIPLIGALLRQEYSLKIMQINIALQILLVMPLLYAIVYIPSFSTIAIIVFSILTAVNAALMPGIICSYIPSYIRFSATSIVFNIAFGIFGGITPWLSSYLLNLSNSFYLPTIYLLIVLLVSLFSSTQIKYFQEKSHA